MTETAAKHEHVFEDRWYPLDRKRIHRICVVPGCRHYEAKEPKA